MNYRVILDPTRDGDLTSLFGATKDIAVFTANKLVDNHGLVSGANLVAQGEETGGATSSSSSSSSSSSGDGGHYGCTPGHICPSGAVPHDPYMIVFGAGAGLGLLVGLIVGVMIGRSSRQAR